MILSNQVICMTCEDRPYSAHRHDFQSCRCGSISVDGGMSYLRRVGSGATDISITISDEHKDLLIAAIQGEDNQNDLGKLCNVARVLRDDMGINIGDAKWI